MRETANYRQFNDSQKHALDAARNLAVRANAGSGKTRVLVERIVQQLAASFDAGTPLPLTAFVAVTFTRKAAGAIQDRLREAFGELAGLALSDAERAYWQERIDELPRALIGTIDAFCARILREFALEGSAAARIEPDFEPLDGYDAMLLRREAIDRVLNRLSVPAAAEPTPAEEACAWWGIELGYAALGRHLDALLLHQVDAAIIVAAHENLPPVEDRVRANWSRLPAVRTLRRERDELRAALEAIIDALDEEANKTQLNFKADATNLLNLLVEDNWTFEIEADLLRGLREMLLTKEGKGKSTRYLDPVEDIVLPLQAEWQPILKMLDFDYAGELRALEAADRLALLLDPVSAEYQRLCRESNRYDFTTLARRTRDLLAGSPSICKLLRTRYRRILVDEFQDTNQLQWEIVSRLAGAGPDGPLERDRLFVVGDPQQSIYRFRHADVGVFTRVQGLIGRDNEAHGLADEPTAHDRAGAVTPSTSAQRRGLMPLGANYRTLAPLPLDLVDRVCRHVFEPDFHGLDLEQNRFEIDYQPLEAGRNSDQPGEVVYVLPADTPKQDEDADPALYEAEEGEEADELGLAQVQAVVDQLVSLHGQPKFSGAADETLRWQDMAILLPSRSVVLTQLEDTLRERHVPFVVTGGIGFWQRQEISDLINLACCLADRGDELSLFAVLRGPLGQCTDAELLFLSQFGLGSLNRGLRLIERANDQLQSAAFDEHAEWVRARWDRLPGHVQSALQAFWSDLPAERRSQVRETARFLQACRQRVDRMAHADMLQRALEESGAYTLYASALDGNLALANLARCFDQIRGLEADAALDLNRLARRLRELRDNVHREEQASLAHGDAVQILTVHAAKGLEFPVVAVMKMERRVKRTHGSALLVKSPWDDLLADDIETFPDVRAGTLALRVRHPDRPRMIYRPMLHGCLTNLERAQSLAESRRLFYVAATRAEERLLLVGREPGLTSTGRPRLLDESWQKWFEQALGISEEHKKLGRWSDSTSGQCVTIVRAVTNVQPPRPTEPTAAPPAIDLDYIHETPQHPVVPTTGLEKMRALWHEDRHAWWLRYRVQLQRDMPKASTVFDGSADDGALGAVIGTMVHRCLELPAAALQSSEDELRPLLTAMAGNLIAPDESDANADADISQAAAATLRILSRLRSDPEKAQALRRLVDEPGESEVPFGLRLGRWYISGRFDKLLKCEDGFEIVDWKTDREDDEDVLAARHAAQMRLYALALHRAGQAQLSAGKINVHLALLGPLSIRTLSFEPAELEEAARALEQELVEMEKS